MECPKCHTNNPDGSIRCANCGYRFRGIRVLGIKLFSKLAMVLFFALTFVGVFGPILCNIQGILPETQVHYDADFLYFFDKMWVELLAYHGSNLAGYGFTMFRCLVLGISCMVAIGGIAITMIVCAIKIFQSYHNNKFATLSSRKMFLFSFIPALQYLVLVRFNFYNSEYNPFTGGKVFTNMGWGSILIILGLIFGIIGVAMEEAPQLEKVDNVDLTRYITFRIATALLIVVAFVGTSSYLNYSYMDYTATEPYAIVYHQNIFDIVTKAYISGSYEVLVAIRGYAIPAIITGSLTIVSLFFAIYNTFTNRRVMLWISVDTMIIMSVVCGVLSRSLVETFYGNGYKAILSAATTNTLAVGAVCIVVLLYNLLRERHGDLFAKTQK
ncbi:MAG: zinc ribbon domain-containing protein [Bacilli bacterium]|nr:zinc ribbon domain-containing protein [Bacilli bacterium]